MITRSCGLRAAPRYVTRHVYNVQVYHSRIHSFHKHPPTPTLRSTITHRSASTTTATRINHNLKVNGPTTTLPPPLVLPVRDPTQSSLKYYYNYGRAHLAFYKNGLKQIYQNHKASRALQRDIIGPKCGGSVQRAVASGLLTRSDFQMLVRSAYDLRRIPIFALVFVVCGEFTPLVVVFMGSVVPRTCQIPKQVLSTREKAEGRRKASFRELVVPPPEGDEGVVGLKREQLLHIGRSLGLHSTWWPEGLGLPPDGLLRARVRKRVEYLEMDDRLIEKDGGVGEMEMEEVRLALEERGLDVLGKSDEQLKMLLRSWLWARKKRFVPTLFLTRPSVWAKTEK